MIFVAFGPIKRAELAVNAANGFGTYGIQSAGAPAHSKTQAPVGVSELRPRFGVRRCCAAFPAAGTCDPTRQCDVQARLVINIGTSPLLVFFHCAYTMRMWRSKSQSSARACRD